MTSGTTLLSLRSRDWKSWRWWGRWRLWGFCFGTYSSRRAVVHSGKPYQRWAKRSWEWSKARISMEKQRECWAWAGWGNQTGMRWQMRFQRVGSSCHLTNNWKYSTILEARALFCPKRNPLHSWVFLQFLPTIISVNSQQFSLNSLSHYMGSQCRSLRTINSWTVSFHRSLLQQFCFWRSLTFFRWLILFGL